MEQQHDAFSINDVW